MGLSVVLNYAVVALFIGGLVYGAFWVTRHPEFTKELGNKIKEKIKSIFKR